MKDCVAAFKLRHRSNLERLPHLRPSVLWVWWASLASAIAAILGLILYLASNKSSLFGTGWPLMAIFAGPVAGEIVSFIAVWRLAYLIAKSIDHVRLIHSLRIILGFAIFIIVIEVAIVVDPVISFRQSGSFNNDFIPCVGGAGSFIYFVMALALFEQARMALETAGIFPKAWLRPRWPSADFRGGSGRQG